jgi:hypothetical protein
MHLLQCNEIQIIKHNSWYHHYTFQHRNAIFSESTNTKDHKYNTTLQVSIAVTAIFKILKWRKTTICNFTCSGIVTWHSGAETCRGDIRNCVLCVFYCTSLLVTIPNTEGDQVATLQNETAVSASHLGVHSNYPLHSRNHV